MKSSHTYVRISSELMGRLAPMAEAIGISQNRFAEQSLAAVVDLADAPAQERRIPRIVRLLDAARHIDQVPTHFPEVQPPIKESPEPSKKKKSQ